MSLARRLARGPIVGRATRRVVWRIIIALGHFTLAIPRHETLSRTGVRGDWQRHFEDPT
jgi:hypothetical protein